MYVRASLLSFLFLVGAVTLSVPTAAWQEGVEGVAAAADLRAEFEILPLREGVLLQPRSGEGPGAIEITDGQVALDGTVVSADELEARLGEAHADWIGRIAELDSEQLQEFLAGQDDVLTAVVETADEGAEAEVVGEGEDADSGVAVVADEVALESEEEKAEREERRHIRRRYDAQVVFGDNVVVEADETAEDVIAIGGSVRIEGEVRGDVAAIGGSVEIDGEVTGDTVSVGGSVRLSDDARVFGDAVSVGGKVEAADGAVVEGRISEVEWGPNISFGPSFDWPNHMWRHGTWSLLRPWKIAGEVINMVFIALLACLAYLVARGPIDRMAARAKIEPWKCGLVGLATLILLVPLLVLLCFVLLVSVIGIPLLFLVPFVVLGIVVLIFFGVTAVARLTGRWLEDRFGWDLGGAYVEILVGLLVILGWGFLGHVFDLGGGPLKLFSAMFALVAAIVCFVVTSVGTGAAVLTRFGTLDRWGSGGAAEPALPPVPPVPTTPEEGAPDADFPPAEELDELLDDRPDDRPEGPSDDPSDEPPDEPSPRRDEEL